MKKACSAVIAALVLGGCAGGEPRHPTPPPHRETPDDGGGDALAGSRDRDRFSVESELPRSGDPARPNVMVEVKVVDVSSSEGLRIRGRVEGSLVQGVLDLRGGVDVRGGSTRERSSTSMFTVVQAGRWGSIQLTDQTACGLVGSYQGLHVLVVSAAAGGPVELELGAAAGTTREGETFGAGTRVRLQSGEAVVLGGLKQSSERSSRGVLRAGESSRSRELLALLVVKVLG